MMSKKLSVMLVDDNPLDLFLCQKFLENESFPDSIKPFNNPVIALDYLTENDASQWPDLILLDIQMPQMDGFEFLQEFEKFPEPKRNKCTIVMVSSTLDFGDINRAKANYFVLDLLEKPLKVKKLIELLEANSIL